MVMAHHEFDRRSNRRRHFKAVTHHVDGQHAAHGQVFGISGIGAAELVIDGWRGSIETSQVEWKETVSAMRVVNTEGMRKPYASSRVP